MKKLLIRLGVLLLFLSGNLTAQPPDLQSRMAALLRYTGLENPAPEDVTRMAELWTRAQQPGIGSDERRTAFRDMYVLFARRPGRDPGSRPAGMETRARFAATTVEGGGRLDLALPEPRGIPQGPYLHVATRGTGPVPLLLISDVGVDGRKLYDSFARRN